MADSAEILSAKKELERRVEQALSDFTIKTGFDVKRLSGESFMQVGSMPIVIAVAKVQPRNG
jgi:hypothetical protein